MPIIQERTDARVLCIAEHKSAIGLKTDRQKTEPGSVSWL
jgi:hypothetical protein